MRLIYNDKGDNIYRSWHDSVHKPRYQRAVTKSGKRFQHHLPVGHRGRPVLTPIANDDGDYDWHEVSGPWQEPHEQPVAESPQQDSHHEEPKLSIEQKLMESVGDVLKPGYKGNKMGEMSSRGRARASLMPVAGVEAYYKAEHEKKFSEVLKDIKSPRVLHFINETRYFVAFSRKYGQRVYEKIDEKIDDLKTRWNNFDPKEFHNIEIEAYDVERTEKNKKILSNYLIENIPLQYQIRKKRIAKKAEREAIAKVRRDPKFECSILEKYGEDVTFFVVRLKNLGIEHINDYKSLNVICKIVKLICGYTDVREVFRNVHPDDIILSFSKEDNHAVQNEHGRVVCNIGHVNDTIIYRSTFGYCTLEDALKRGATFIPNRPGSHSDSVLVKMPPGVRFPVYAVNEITDFSTGLRVNRE